MTDDLVARLRADELPGDRQRHIEARIELWAILQESANRIERLEAALRGVIAVADRDCPEFREARAALAGEEPSD